MPQTPAYKGPLREGYQRYEVWLEGYQATGNSGTAQYLGNFAGRSFPEACKVAVLRNGMNPALYDSERNAFWGCRFFNNEARARRNFG